MRVLVVEDDARLAEQLHKGLEEAGFVTERVRTGEEGLATAVAGTFDAILLDITLPGKDGWWVLKQLRSRDVRTPVICVTAQDGVDHAIHGLDLGADDYLTKPFSFAELLARLRAVLRRGSGAASDHIYIADLEIVIPARRARRGGKPLDLRPKEFSLLLALARRPGHVMSRAVIVDRVWEAAFDYDTNVVDVHIRRLRETVDDPFAVKLIHTVRGAGYVLEDRS